MIAALASCSEDSDDLFTTADIELTADSLTINRVQGTISLTNLNSQDVTRYSSFTGNMAHVSILRGAYSIQVAGTVELSDSQGRTTISQFRAYTDYCGLEKSSGNSASLKIELMQ